MPYINQHLTNTTRIALLHFKRIQNGFGNSSKTIPRCSKMMHDAIHYSHYFHCENCFKPWGFIIAEAISTLYECTSWRMWKLFTMKEENPQNEVDVKIEFRLLRKCRRCWEICFVRLRIFVLVSQFTGSSFSDVFGEVVLSPRMGGNWS